MSLVVRRIVVRIGALRGIVIARFIDTHLPYCVGALTTVRRIHTRHHGSCLGALPINPSVESRIYITISQNDTPGGAQEIMETISWVNLGVVERITGGPLLAFSRVQSGPD